MPDYLRWEEYVKILETEFAARELFRITNESLARQTNEPDPVKEIAFLTKNIESIRELIGGKKEDTIFSFRDMSRVLREDLERDKGELLGLTTGIDILDKWTAGLCGGQLWVIGGWSGHHKTSLALKMARSACFKNNAAVLYYSAEMNAEEIGRRIASAELKIDHEAIRTGKELTDIDKERIKGFLSLKRDSRFTIQQDGGISIEEVCRQAERFHDGGLCDILFLDYIHLFDSEKRFNQNRQLVAYITKTLKRLAKKLNIPVVALSQLRKKDQNAGKNKKPELHDLRESGGDDADTVVLLYCEDLESEEDIQELDLAKQRAGKTGLITGRWIGQYMEIEG